MGPFYARAGRIGSMELNPYQSPREAGYDPPRPHVSLWRRFVVVLAVVVVGLIAFSITGATLDYLREIYGF